VRTLALATVELKEAPVACKIEGCWQTSTASYMTFIYLCIHFCCQVIMRILELPLADQLHPAGFDSSSQIFFGKERKPPQTIF
jgi:hypothetical protein